MYTEDMELYLWFSATLGAILSTIVLTLLLPQVLLKGKSRGNKREAPEAKGAWPVIGHLHLLAGGSQQAHKILGDMAETYGPIFTIKLGVHKALVVSNSEIAKECFTTNDKVFASRPNSKAVELMGYDSAMFGLAPYGDYWREMRKIMMLQVLSQRRVEMLGHVRASEVKASMKDIFEAWVIKNKESGNTVMKMEMKQWCWNLILNISVRTISGKRFSFQDEKRVKAQNAARKFFELLGAFVVSDFIPWLKPLDLGGYEKEMKMTAKEMDNIFEGWLEEHKRDKEDYSDDHEGNKEDCFMDVLISILEGASKEDFLGFDHDTIIKASCLGILSASSETTSLTLTWALSLLLNNPRVLKKAQDEIDEHIGRERLVEESDMKDLVYLDAIIKETLRLYPAAPLSVPRESMEDCIVGGYNIPKGTRLFLNLWKIHNDPNTWSEPYEFRPERFLTSHKDIDIKGNHFELLPFGSGRRICPGILFAMKSLHLTLASLIQQFMLKRPSNELIDMTGSVGMNNTKAMPLEVLLTPRLSLDMYPTIGA